MSIGATIKKLRQARKLTQEELACYLGITAKAISQWECDRTSPTVSQIPALCNFFHISADELLNINQQNTTEKKQQILKKSFALSKNGYLKEAWDVLQEGLNIFPNDYAIMIHLTLCGDRIIKFTSCADAEKESIQTQCASYCNRILNGCVEDLTRHAAVSYLCTYYTDKGEIQKAEELAGKMPIMAMSQDFLRANIYKGTKNKDANQRLKFDLLQFLLRRFTSNYQLDSGEKLYSPAELEALREKKISLLELLFENGDYGFYSEALSDTCEACARYYATCDEPQQSLMYLEKAARSAVDFMEFMKSESIIHTSLLFKKMTESTSGISRNVPHNQAQIILKNMQRKEYCNMHETKQFMEIAAFLESYQI